VKNLGSVSNNALDLVAFNRAGLDKDLTQLTRVLQSVKANIGSVQQLLDATPLFTTGLQGAYAPDFHRIDLRTQLSPTLSQFLGNLGLPFGPCLPIDVSCTPVASSSAAAAKAPAAAAAAPAAPQPAAPAAASAPPAPAAPNPTTTTTSTTGPNPLNTILQLFGSSGTSVGAVGAGP